MEKVIAAGNESGGLLYQLRAEHAALDARLCELERHVSHTPAEQLEMARIKKLKLVMKDRLALLGRQGNA